MGVCGVREDAAWRLTPFQIVASSIHTGEGPVPRGDAVRALELGLTWSDMMEQLACKATGSKKAPRRAAFTLVMTSILKPGETLPLVDQVVLGNITTGDGKRGFARMWKQFLVDNPRYADPAEAGGRRSAKEVLPTLTSAMAAQTLQAPSPLAGKLGNMLVASEELVRAALVKAVPGYTGKEAHKFANGARFHNYSGAGGKSKARSTPFNGKRSKREKRDVA